MQDDATDDVTDVHDDVTDVGAGAALLGTGVSDNSLERNSETSVP